LPTNIYEQCDKQLQNDRIPKVDVAVQQLVDDREDDEKSSARTTKSMGACFPLAEGTREQRPNALIQIHQQQTKGKPTLELTQNQGRKTTLIMRSPRQRSAQSTHKHLAFAQHARLTKEVCKPTWQ
jgi:hypothetical protein